MKKTKTENLVLKCFSGYTVYLSAAFAVSFITFLVYIPALGNDFVNWDDAQYVYKNQHIQSLDLKFLGWAFSSVVVSNWHPLTLASLALDHAIWGLNPMGFHLTNVAFHVLNTLLVFILTLRLVDHEKGDKTTCNPTALAAGIVTALLFGTHPLHVESVAWVSERKDVLCAFFFLLSIGAYLEYVSPKYSSNGPKKQLYYGCTLFFFILALLSKPMAVTLPFVLLILDFHPLGRLDGRRRGWAVVEKIPLFILSAASSAMTLWAQHGGEGLKDTGTLSARRAYSQRGSRLHILYSEDDSAR